MKKRVLAIFLGLFLVSGCSWFSSVNPFSTEYDEANAPGKVKMAAGVNPYLWQATLAKLSFMPLDTADSNSGVVTTDWSSIGDDKDESFKITVHILSRELRTDALEVVVFKRVWEDGKW